MPISSPIISRALRDISSCGGGGWGGATHRRAYAALGAGGGVLPSLCLAGFFSGERLLRGAAGGGCAMAGGGGSGRGVRLWDIILWSGTLLRTALAYVEPKGRDKVEAMSSYVTTSHVDLPCHFSSSAFRPRIFSSSFLPSSLHPSTSPRSHPCRDRHSLIRPNSLPRRSTEGIGSYPSF